MRHTRFMQIHIVSSPSAEPLEDDLTRKVDYIFSTLIKGEPDNARSVLALGKGLVAEKSKYQHPRLGFVATSLTPYLIRHCRENLTQEDITWIERLYEIVQDVDAYYSLKDIKPVYYFKIYQANGYWGYEAIFMVKAIGSVQGIQKSLLEGNLYEEIEEMEYIDNYPFAIFHNELVEEGVKAEFYCLSQEG